MDDSASELGQWVHDNLPRKFSFMDLDGVIWKAGPNVLRIVEQKHPGQGLKLSQRLILPLLAGGIDGLIEQGKISRQSGVFVVHTDPPFDSAFVAPVNTLTTITARRLTGDEWKRFMSGEILRDER